MSGASELRPHHAFAFVALILACAVVKLGVLAAREQRAPVRATVEASPLPRFSIVDRHGVSLARTRPRLDLVLSPNAMWQAHTPELMAEEIAAALGGTVAPDELLFAFLPDAAAHGYVRTELPLSAEQGACLDRWLRTGRSDRDGEREEPPVDGVWLEPAPDGTVLCWDPLVVLSRAQRRRHDVERYPQTWTRRLADRIAECLWGPASPHVTASEREATRAAVWKVLLPSDHHVAIEGFDARYAAELDQCLIAQGVARHQMRIERAEERVHPDSAPAIVGGFAFPTRGEVERELRAAYGLAAREPVPADLARTFENEVLRRCSLRRPKSGLELAAARWLVDGPDLAVEPSTYAIVRHRPARHRSRPYFHGASEKSAAPRVVATIDDRLTRFVGRELEAVLDEHRAALAQAIVVDVDSGEVLACDARSAYARWGIAAIHHRFTPGSTMKAVVMATALEHGLVRPNEVFDVGYQPMPLRNPDTGRVQRFIHEAESTRHGELTAAECLAHSSNRGMTRIGLRIPPEVLRGTLVRLGYGAAPATGLGDELGGYLPALPWKRAFTHASISFGHELMVTLWQHAEALATIVRGGVHRPLRVLAALEVDERRWEPVPNADDRVFSERTCATVRAMMELGAREGTGDQVAAPELVPELLVGTKTGTAEKVPSEICLHAELGHAETCVDPDHACRASLRYQRPGHSTCYTSSMAVFGRRRDGGRELLVVVVVDEPRGKERYGSRVAGPTAVRILREALGVTRAGEQPVGELLPGFAASALAAPSWAGEEPWSEGVW